MLEIFVVAHNVADLGASENVERSRLEVNHGRRSDSNFGANKRALGVVFGDGYQAARFVEEAHLPQRRIAGTSCVERVNAVVLGGDEENIMLAFAGNFDRRNK